MSDVSDRLRVIESQLDQALDWGRRTARSVADLATELSLAESGSRRRHEEVLERLPRPDRAPAPVPHGQEIAKIERGLIAGVLDWASKNTVAILGWATAAASAVWHALEHLSRR